MNKTLIINFVLFQIGWFACVLGGAFHQPVLGSAIALSIIIFHLYNSARNRPEFDLLLLAIVIGFIFESAMVSFNLAHYSNAQFHQNIAPYWMILMWPLFATTLNLSMRWLKKLSLVLVALIGAVFAPIAYFAGSNLGAVVYDDTVISLSVIALAWALLFPALVVAARRLNGYELTDASVIDAEVRQHV